MDNTELPGRLGAALVRTFDLVMKGAFSDVALSDLGIIAAGVGIIVVSGGLFFVIFLGITRSTRAALALTAIAAGTIAAGIMWP